MTTNRITFLWLLTLITIVLSCYLLGCSENPTSAICYEDQPCWDCHTMGNKICGEKN